MLKSKTVFVLGAGASKEVGLPVGSELKSTIAAKLDWRISQRMLTFTLGGLERDGLVTPTVFPTTPQPMRFTCD
jgi:DNA-binding HxlR family transcriptional regulator